MLSPNSPQTVGGAGAPQPQVNGVDPLIGAAAIGAAGMALGAGAGFFSDSQNRRFNRTEAQKQRDWQERMSNTAWQRSVADMRAAGINPIYSAMKGGGPTPVGSGASASSSHAAGPATMMAGAQIATQLAQAKLMNAQAAKTEAEIPHVQAGIKEIEARTNTYIEGLEKIRAEVANVKADTDTKQMVQREIGQRILQLEQLTRKYTSEANSAEDKARIDKAVADFQTSLGGDIERWSNALGIKMRDLLHVLSAAGIAKSLFSGKVPTHGQNTLPDWSKGWKSGQ